MAVVTLASCPFIPILSLSAAVGLSTVHPMLLKISLTLNMSKKCTISAMQQDLQGVGTHLASVIFRSRAMAPTSQA